MLRKRTVMPLPPIPPMKVGRFERFRDVAARDGAAAAIRLEYRPPERRLLLPNFDIHEI